MLAHFLKKKSEKNELVYWYFLLSFVLRVSSLEEFIKGNTSAEWPLLCG